MSFTCPLHGFRSVAQSVCPDCHAKTQAELESERTARREAEFNVNVTLPELREQVAQLIAAVEEHEKDPRGIADDRLYTRVRSISQGEAE